MTQLIGIDIGGTNLRLGVVASDIQADSKPVLLQEMRFHADFSGLCKTHQAEVAWQKILGTLSDAIAAVRAQYPQVQAVGIGFPGFIDPNTQRIAQSPNLPGLHHVDLAEDLSALTGLPVIVENDALAAAYGEFTALGDNFQHLIYLGLGTGVGGGLILNRQPFQGQNGVAMEVGHIITQANGRLCGCGNHGCMEQYASASGVTISYQLATHEVCTAAEIAARAKAGDVHAIAAYDLAGRSLAQALAHILKVIDVTDVLIGGGMSAGWPLMETAFFQQLETDLIPVLRGKVQVRLTAMGDQAGMLGAAMLALQKI